MCSLHSLRVYGELFVTENRPWHLMIGATVFCILGGKTMKNKKIWIAIVALIAVVALMMGIYVANR